MFDKKSWDEFRKSGMLWFINRSLHIFGWAILCEYDDEKKIDSCISSKGEMEGFHRKG